MTGPHGRRRAKRSWDDILADRERDTGHSGCYLWTIAAIFAIVGLAYFVVKVLT